MQIFDYYLLTTAWHSYTIISAVTTPAIGETGCHYSDAVLINFNYKLETGCINSPRLIPFFIAATAFGCSWSS